MFNYIKDGVDSYGDKAKVVNIPKIILHVVGLIVLLTIVFGSFGTISAGEVGVKTRLNAVIGTVPPGLYFKLPLIEDVYPMSVKTLTINYDKAGDVGDEKVSTDNLFGASKDLQDVAIGVVVNYHIDATKVSEIYSQYSSVENYQASVLEPMIREVVKSTSAQYTAEELVTKRTEYSDKVNKTLSEGFGIKNSILEKFSVTNFEFSASFTAAIESKVTAVQNAEAAKNKLEQIKFEAQQTIETAKAQAESIRIQAGAINSQGGADYIALQAIKQWDGHYPTTVMGGSTIPLIQLK